MAFEEITPEQENFIITFLELVNSGDYEPEFHASAVVTGWFVIVSGKNGKPGLQLDGYTQTMFESLDKEGYLTISWQGEDSLLGSPRKKAYIEYEKYLNGGKTKGSKNVVTGGQDSTRNVFVVHGRNLAVRDAMFALLSSMDLRPIEWSEARELTGKTNPYVGEILDAAFQKAQAVIVLFTPEDVAFLHPKFLKTDDKENERNPVPQARQNVLFEAGMAMGRDEKRTLLVEFGDLRPFSDIYGRHMLRFHNSIESRKELAQRLKSAGCSVNLLGEAWLKAGDFAKEKYDLSPASFGPRVSRPDLEADEKVILKEIGESDNTEAHATQIELMKANGFSRTKSRYLLDSLRRKKLIIFQVIPIKGEVFHLTELGRIVAIENDLVI